MVARCLYDVRLFQGVLEVVRVLCLFLGCSGCFSTSLQPLLWCFGDCCDALIAARELQGCF